MSPDFAFPDLYRLWREHDLALTEDLESIQPWFYEGLAPEDEPRVWRFIEESYLLKYREFLSVSFEWSSSGLWGIPFPGSVSFIYHLEDLRGIDENARRLLAQWHDPLDDARRLDDDSYFDYEASDARGLSAAREIRRSLGEDVYLEFQPFQEITYSSGMPAELDVPDFILDLSGAERPIDPQRNSW